MVRITKKIDYAISGALGRDELGALLQAAAGSTYTATELEKVIAHSTAYVTARDGKRLVGFGRLFSDGAVVAYLNNLAVEPSYRRLGIGKAILTALIAAAGNVRSIFLYTNTADALYQREGFFPSEKRLYVRKTGVRPEVSANRGDVFPPFGNETP